jgi:hypothetical protein
VEIGDAVVARRREWVWRIFDFVEQPEIDDRADAIGAKGFFTGRCERGEAVGADNRSPSRLPAIGCEVTTKVAGVEATVPWEEALARLFETDRGLIRRHSSISNDIRSTT